ncbi:possible gamma-tubulin complex 4 [Cryptosporidium parvum Iowa II]|uniref:Possible gamma-tubulin complex 4 n=2 Tax=Cryptosporidium parvum TaxID=5807 RepID=Q5CPS0_CRYPI|nr:possible gamma-tubulin complex 4 [Cryptosporidium parvum Iowa II]EAK87418.1 possible gamma-tubulin complex 4 [Cryptosporidium parvum Iowa II]WKS77627.1 putative gamma-tubulin complex 4 [Cryptosporidium sp. 43IA8]
MNETGFESYINQISNILNESFPHIQSQLEGFLEKFRREISFIMYESIILRSQNNIAHKFAYKNLFSQNIKLIRNLYFLGYSDIFLQLDNSIFYKNLSYDDSQTRNTNFTEQSEFISNTWKELLSLFKLGNITSSIHNDFSNSRINLCCDTFDLFNFNLNELELIDMFNCSLTNNNILLFGGKSEMHADQYLHSENEKLKNEGDEGHEDYISEDFGITDCNFDFPYENFHAISISRVKWPIRIIDGFNHILECVSSVNVVSSLLFAASNSIPFIGDGICTSQEDGSGHDGEFLRLTWSFRFKDENKQVMEFCIKLYWHTKHLRSLLNTEKEYSLLKTNLLEVPNPFINLMEGDLFAYRLRILFKQSNISIYMEPLKNTLPGSNSLFGRPTQVLSIQHINIDICLPLHTSSCFIHLLRHNDHARFEKEKEFKVFKWCHISSSNNSDVISQLANSCSMGASSSTNYNFNLLKNVSLNSYLSGISFDHHIFRLRIIQKFDWPLPLLFTKKNMEHYYNLFDFYWLFFRTYNGLERIWREAFNLRYGNRRGAFTSFSIEHPVNHFWNYIFYCRWVLQVTIGEYYSFLQHFVVEQSFRDFLDKVKEEQDFENIIQKHNDLVQTLILKSGFLLPSILNPLTSILVLTGEWSYSIFREISRWNDSSEFIEANYTFSNAEEIKFPWDSDEWQSIINSTINFMNNFILLWDNLCSEISIVSSNIQYQHFSLLLSIFNNHKWNIDIPDLNNANNRKAFPYGSFGPSHSDYNYGDDEYREETVTHSVVDRSEDFESDNYTDSREEDNSDNYFNSQDDLEDDYDNELDLFRGEFNEYNNNNDNDENNNENKQSQYSPHMLDGTNNSYIELINSKLSATYLKTNKIEYNSYQSS